MQPNEHSVDLSGLGIPDLEVLKEKFPAVKDMDPSELLQKLQLIIDKDHLNISKVDRKLYIGNIPAGFTSQSLMELLNSALQKMSINIEEGNSIIGAWMSPKDNSAFVDFRTLEEAMNGFILSSFATYGQVEFDKDTLKIGLPGSNRQTQALQDSSSTLLVGQGERNTIRQLLKKSINQLYFSFKEHTKDVRNIINLEIDEKYNEIFENIRGECSRIGTVISMKIPKPKNGIEVPGLGKAFVQFKTIDEAKQAQKELHGRIFGEGTAEVAYHDEDKYAQDDLSD